MREIAMKPNLCAAFAAELDKKKKENNKSFLITLQKLRRFHVLVINGW